MRILHVISTLDPSAGGPPIVAQRLSAAEAEAGHDVRILSYDSPSSRDRINGLFQECPGGAKITQQALAPPGKVERILGIAARRAIEGVIADVQLVHVHGIWEALLKVACDVAHQRQIPYVITPHGMLDPWSLRQKRWKKRLALFMGYRRMLERAAFLHVLNEDEKRLLVPLGLRCPIEIVPNGIFAEEVRTLPSPGTFYGKYPELHEHPFIFFMARLHHKKGLDYLANAFAIAVRRLPHIRLVVAGPDFGEKLPFERLVADLGVASRVHVLPPIFGPEKFAALVDSSCFCLPSRQEGFSVAILEAMACGVPVVISDACHFPEVERAGAGRVVSLDEEKIADALVEVLANQELRRDMGRRGRELALTQYTWPEIAQRMLNAYQAACARQSADQSS
jgi:glycosyltransferase involved in cell wall biosynthesis